MPTPNQENFKYYKLAESKALEILAEMKATTPKKMDIELALKQLSLITFRKRRSKLCHDQATWRCLN